MLDLSAERDVVVIGGGFFGMYVAEHFAVAGQDVLLVERDSDFMQRASFVNQARIHNGYHYPRSILTAMRSRVSFPRFCAEFKECVDDSFEKYYMVAKILGKVTARQFREFCTTIGAPCQPAPKEVVELVNPNLIEEVFSTEEVAFDAVKLKRAMEERLQAAGVTVRLGVGAERVQRKGAGLEVVFSRAGDLEERPSVAARQVFNCTYAMTNALLTRGGLDRIPLTHEMTELCLVDVPDVLKHRAITVMCGPFFSVMPFPPAAKHSFSHVRYTPHYHWNDRPELEYVDAYKHAATSPCKSVWRKMKLDAQRYIPILEECRYSESMFEVKTTLPRSATDDSRPILFKLDYGLPGFHCLLGGKIDNVYDVVDVIEERGLSQR